MAAASYDQLLRQVEVLKMENSNLRQELQDNSNHLTKLETEASNMKEVLKQLQGTIEEDSGEATGSQLELIERLKEMSLDSAGLKPRSRPSLPTSSSSSSASSGSGATAGPAAGTPTPAAIPRRGLPSAGRDSQDRCLEELEKERSLLLAELEKEEKEKDWYYAQLQNLTKRIDSLPLTENFTLQTDMSRRQLEFEARQIRSAMEEQLGSCQEMERRAQARVSRIQQIEKDILRLGARLHVEETQGASDSSGLAGAQSSSSRLDHEPANERATLFLDELQAIWEQRWRWCIVFCPCWGLTIKTTCRGRCLPCRALRTRASPCVSPAVCLCSSSCCTATTRTPCC
uniref:Adenomatous polyposis coli N-terminal dimerisation domain-containing protein n=1 Tax=Labrus bergylta TaxID=56723 RepID=A0A3Q3G9J1_9LABR